VSKSGNEDDEEDIKRRDLVMKGRTMTRKVGGTPPPPSVESENKEHSFSTAPASAPPPTTHPLHLFPIVVGICLLDPLTLIKLVTLSAFIKSGPEVASIPSDHSGVQVTTTEP